ncbi:hypothetical protein LJ737_21585 [Hymenobacter sp. 15J16-1T3B]|uniref:hypothetical protein n=1 Tax=Hymenobacter sp. 15J16-1T3B TaxID=2886941 RepID=UPI001D10EB24|nr:hypothetical protein [Hymenobacter sp. 15J16-1T3B]MCC3159849.1 hypothetical protein [Hymenobacter sp. 15J16-1T3B]
MKTPFRLDEHPRRPQPPLAPPAADFFDKLPLRVMQRVRPAADADAAPAWGWLAALSAPLRTALASVVVLLTFVGSFWLASRPGSQPAVRPLSAAQALAAVPRAEAVQYLLSDAAPRLTLADLADTHVAERDLTADFLPGTDADIQAALDEQPSLDVYL